MSVLRDRLAEQGLTTRPTARWKEGPLSLNQLSLVLRDPYYLGMVTYKGQVFDGRHEALVSAETFERVQEVLAVRKRPTQRDQVHAHFLRGLMCCDRCHEAGRERRMISPKRTTARGDSTDTSCVAVVRTLRAISRTCQSRNSSAPLLAKYVGSPSIPASRQR